MANRSKEITLTDPVHDTLIFVGFYFPLSNIWIYRSK